jgi:hypothetical protein
VKYSTQDDSLNARSLFIVSITDQEFEANGPGYNKLRNFENLILNRLANIIVGYLFKHHRDELIKPILESVQEKVSKEVSKEILQRLGLPLEF